MQADANVPVMHAEVVAGRAPPFMSSLMPSQPLVQAQAVTAASSGSRHPFLDGAEAGHRDRDGAAFPVVSGSIQMQVRLYVPYFSPFSDYPGVPLYISY